MSITKTPTSMIDPTGATAGQVLTYDGSTSTWVASALPAAGNTYTTVGNASAGIFVSAVCFIPSDPGTGTWTAPAGCYTARVTLVGSGGSANNGGGSVSGNRSHFNYPAGTTTGLNQLFAEGGMGGLFNTGGNGGSSGWNGINSLAVGGQGVATTPTTHNSKGGGAGTGGSSGGGFGGGGGGGTAGGASGGSFGGRGGDGLSSGSYGAGGSGGINGSGTTGTIGGQYTIGTGGCGGGSPMLSYAATSLANFNAAISQGVGGGGSSPNREGGGGGGWATAIVSVTPGQSYSYAVAAAAGTGAEMSSYGMVVIEW